MAGGTHLPRCGRGCPCPPGPLPSPPGREVRRGKFLCRRRCGRASRERRQVRGGSPPGTSGGWASWRPDLRRGPGSSRSPPAPPSPAAPGLGAAGPEAAARPSRYVQRRPAPGNEGQPRPPACPWRGAPAPGAAPRGCGESPEVEGVAEPPLRAPSNFSADSLHPHTPPSFVTHRESGIRGTSPKQKKKMDWYFACAVSSSSVNDLG